MNDWIYLSAWGFMTAAAALSVAAKVDWSSAQSALGGGALVCAALGAALMHPPAQSESPPAPKPTVVQLPAPGIRPPGNGQ